MGKVNYYQFSERHLKKTFIAVMSIGVIKRKLWLNVVNQLLVGEEKLLNNHCVESISFLLKHI